MAEMSRTRKLATKVIFAAFGILKENGGEMRSRDVIAEIEKRVDLGTWAEERYVSSGATRWVTILRFFSIDCVKAGFLVKKAGAWYLTEEGEQAIELGPEGLLAEAKKRYDEWSADRKGLSEAEEEDVDEAGNVALASMDQIQEMANASLERHIAAKNAYELQDLAAALLRGMGYFTPFVAPRGKDGGIDIVGYRDPLGTITPRIRAQVKHRKGPAGAQDIRQLMGILQKDGDVGIFISTGGFTSDAKVAARGGHIHVELIDVTRFIELWQQHYSKLTDEDRVLMPLVPVYFLADVE
jgi:restriction system protein